MMIKYFIIFLSLLFYITISATNFYLDSNSPTKGNAVTSTGRDWAHAWSNWDSTDGFYYDNDGVNWLAIGDGDTLYVAGGHYTNAITTGNHFTQGMNWTVRPVVCTSWEAGYNGTVYLDGDTVEAFSGGIAESTSPYLLLDNGSELNRAANGMLVWNETTGTDYAHIINNSSSNPYLMELDKDIFSAGDLYRCYWISHCFRVDSALNNIKFVGFTVNYQYETSGAGAIYLADHDGVVLEDFTIITNGWMGASASIQTCAKDTIRNCKFIAQHNSKRQEQDNLGMSAGRGGHVLENNLYIIDNDLYEILGDGANMTVSANSFTDTDLSGADAMPTNMFRGAWLTVGSWYFPCDSNTTNTFYGKLGWEVDATGTADASVSATATSLTDTRLTSMTTNDFVGATISCGSSTMIITGNTSNTFSGSSWTGGTPSNGQSWTVSANGGTPVSGRDWTTGTGAHRDQLQISDMGVNDGTNYETVIRNNILINRGVSQGYCNAIYYSDGIFGNQRMIIAGNINYDMTYSRGDAYSQIRMRDHPNGFKSSLRIFNNTIITHGVGGQNQALNLDWIDTLQIKNNVIVNMSDITVQMELGPNNNYSNINIDYNAYVESGQFENQFCYYVDITGANRPLSAWRSKGWDAVNIDTVNYSASTWINLGDTTYAGYYTNVGRDSGIDTSMFSQYTWLRYDMAGNIRANDKGALEFQGSGEINKIMGVTSPSKILGKTINKIFGIIFVP